MLRRALLAAVLLAVLGEISVIAYIAAEGSATIVHGDNVAHGCATPAVRGWMYEAINYDIALDARLPTDNPDWLDNCPRHGAGTAGTDVVSADGIRVAGWYIPSGDGDPPDAPTVVIVHGWGTNKSDTLRYAAVMHDLYNVVLVDLRSAGRSSGDEMTVGPHEALDLRAMLDWLVHTKHPTSIAFLGDSGGAAASAMLARTDTRIHALILESPHARAANPFAERIGTEGAKLLGVLNPPAALSAWVVQLGVWLRTGARPADADPLNSIPTLGSRPLAILYGTADDVDLPDANARLLFSAAQAAGVPVEIHACEGARHGKVVDACPTQYRAWVLAFLERAFAR